MNKNICTACNTENEPEYKFCKNCGTPLNVISEEKVNFEANQPKAEETFENSTPNGGFYDFQFNGASTEEMGVFIGKKAMKILPKFTKMELSNSKISWCWPAAILGFIFGPMGSALWFFFRKMYKMAFVFAIIGAVIMISTSVMTAGIDAIYEDMGQQAADFMVEFNLGGILDIAEDANSKLTPAQKILQQMADAINSFASAASGIISGLFGYWLYKNHCIRKISTYKVSGVDSRFYKMGLASIGGTSGGMLTVGLVLMFVTSQLATYISKIILAVI